MATVTVCKGCGSKLMGVDSKTNKAACPMCIGIEPESGKPVKIKVPKTAKCIYCGHEQKNNGGLPFYSSKFNTYYCGCRGWD